MCRDRALPPTCHLILLIGLPGCGKSTLAKQMMADCPALRLVSTDHIRQQLFGDESIQGPWLKVWAEVERQLSARSQQVRQGQAAAVVYDATNAVRRNRRDVIQLARSVGFTRLSGIWLDVSMEECLRRNQQRDRQVPQEIIERMERSLRGAPPATAEGLHPLIRCQGYSLQLISMLFAEPPVC